ncbi:MAG: arsenite methyltransferase [Desulfovibrionaceae bacterium]|nr:arsenite methyltransferase [Desulfovibrionaceae bacterium]
MNERDKAELQARILEDYTSIATGTARSCCGGSGCCGGTDAGALSASLGYAAEDLARLPEGADMGLSCGNPGAIAAIREGEVVLDLGSGGGFDAFLAGPRAGAAGRVIGVDMTPAMIARARKACAVYRERTGLDNVEFRLGEIEHLPVGDASVDVVISNCVINLSIDKAQVWREIFRVLRPGGRVAVSDMVLREPLPAAAVAPLEAWSGCVAGAMLLAEAEALIKKCGFEEISVVCRPGYAASMEAAGDPLYARICRQLPPGKNPADFIASAELSATKPARRPRS